MEELWANGKIFHRMKIDNNPTFGLILWRKIIWRKIRIAILAKCRRICKNVANIVLLIFLHILKSSKNAIMIRIWLFEKDLLLALPQKSWNSCYDFNFLNSLYERMFAKIWGPRKRTSSFSRQNAALKWAPNFVTGKNKTMENHPRSPLKTIWAVSLLAVSSKYYNKVDSLKSFVLLDA